MRTQPFPSPSLQGRRKKDNLFQKTFLKLCEMIYRVGVLYTRSFIGYLGNELQPYLTKKNVSTPFATILGFRGAEVKCKFCLNWALIEAVFKQPVKRRETIQLVGLYMLQGPSIIGIIL